MKQLAWTFGILLYGLMFTVIKALDFTDWAGVVIEYSFWVLVLLFTRKSALKYFKRWNTASLGNVLFIVPIVYALFFHASGATTAVGVLHCLSAALGEELAFRLFLPWLLSEKCHFRSMSTLIISSLIFGLFHTINIISGIGPFYTAIQVLYASCIGFGLCAFVCETGTLLPCVILHTLLNIFSANAVSASSITVCITAGVLFVGYGIYICKAELRRKGSEIYYETIH